jgi:tetratricopeptide (TPR) repeat protein
VRYLEGRRADAEALVMPFIDEVKVSGDGWAAGMVYVLLASVRLWEGRTSEAIEPAREARELFRAMQDLRGEVQATGVLARSLVASGRVGEGLSLLDDLRTLSHPSHMGAFGADAGVAIANVTIHLGDGETALTALADRVPKVGMGLVEVPEVACYRGLALLQLGRIDEAVASLEVALDGAKAAGPRAASSATMALAQAAAGNLTAAVSAAEEALATDVATYLDRVYAILALAFVAVQAGDATGAKARFAEALLIVDGTGDRMQQAAVRLARARGLEALGDPRADEAIADAGGHFELLGLPATGWDTAYHLAAQPRPQLGTAFSST